MQKTRCHPPKWTSITTEDWDKLPTVLTTEQVAVLLQKSVDTVKKHLRSGDISGMKLGKDWLIDREKLRQKLQGD